MEEELITLVFFVVFLVWTVIKKVGEARNSAETPPSGGNSVLKDRHLSFEDEVEHAEKDLMNEQKFIASSDDGESLLKAKEIRQKRLRELVVWKEILDKPLSLRQ